MPILDPIAQFQFAGIAITWLAAVLFWFWRIRKSTGTDRDILLLVASVGGCVFLTVLQVIGLLIRLG